MKHNKNKKATPAEYLERAEVGALVAFKTVEDDVERTLSGKIESKTETGIVVVTKNGTAFHLMPEDIIWVKTGARWPGWVFEQFRNKSK